MPRVPTYDNAQVAPQNIPSAQLQPPGVRFQTMLTQEQATLPGRQLQEQGQAMVSAGSAFARIATDEMERANRTRVNDAMNQMAKARLDLTHNPEIGYRRLRGEAALNRPNEKSLDQEYTEKLLTQVNTLADGLGNDAQRRMFREQAEQQLVQFQGNLTEHLAREYTDYQLGVQEGTVAVAREQMALSWSDPRAVQQARETIQAATYERGNLLGLSAQQIEANTVEALSPAHTAVISSAVDAGNIEYAKEYLSQYREELTAPARLDVQRLVDTGDFEQRTQYAAGDIWAKHEGDIGAALSEARERYTGKDEDAIITRLKTMDSEREAIRARQQRDAADAAWRLYSETGSTASIPASVLGALDGKDLLALRNTARADAAGRPVETDSEVYYALTLAAATDPNFVNEDLRRYYDKLSPTHRQHFADVQAGLSKPGNMSELATVTQQKSAIISALGLKDKDVGVFHQVADNALLAAQTEKGSNLTQDERQRVLDRLVLQGTTPGGLLGFAGGTRDTFRFNALAEGRPFTVEWTETQRRQASLALQRQGIQTPTQQQIEAVLQATYGEQ